MKLENKLNVVYFLGMGLLLGLKIVELNWLVIPAVAIGVLMFMRTNRKPRATDRGENPYSSEISG